jgi:hypothetical protein
VVSIPKPADTKILDHTKVIGQPVLGIVAASLVGLAVRSEEALEYLVSTRTRCSILGDSGGLLAVRSGCCSFDGKELSGQSLE